MKNLLLLLVIGALIALTNCSKDNEDDRFILLTTPAWASDSLLANGADASGPGQPLEKFKGNAKFNADGSGTFGIYKGTWRFPDKSRTQLVLVTDSFPIPITTNIVELTEKSLKITSTVPDMTGTVPGGMLNVRMTFKAR
jgi:hypothetical protein